jgi:methionine-rich copper-binding protein CopC
VLATLVVLLLVPALGQAHASLVKSVPARRAVLTRPPDRVQLWFNEPIEPRFSRVSVWNAAGQQVDLSDLRVDPGNPKLLSVGLPASLPPGAYAARYRVLSVDGHVVEGELPFTLHRR